MFMYVYKETRIEANEEVYTIISLILYISASVIFQTFFFFLLIIIIIKGMKVGFSLFVFFLTSFYAFCKYIVIINRTSFKRTSLIKGKVREFCR
jgi:hypothetical protein